MKNSDPEKPQFLTWDSEKENLTSSLSDIEKLAIDQMAYLVAEIAKRRRILGLSQQEVATRAGITQAQVARIERSHTVPKWDTVIKVAIALGLRMSFEEASASTKHREPVYV
jgi:DNA-binding phage protein